MGIIGVALIALVVIVYAIHLIKGRLEGGTLSGDGQQ
jgi:hypothetical protein